MLATVMIFISFPSIVFSEGLTVGQIGADDNATLIGKADVFEEDVALRDAYSKHYILENGERFAVIFPEAVHYKENNEWLEVDNRLTYNSATDKYVSTNPKFITAFAGHADSAEIVSVSDGEVTAHRLGTTTVTATVTDSSDEVVATHSTVITVSLGNAIYSISHVELTENFVQINPFSPHDVVEYFSDCNYEDLGTMFKIYHLGNGIYSIRSMADNRYGFTVSSQGYLVHQYIGTVQQPLSENAPDGVPLNSQWIIEGSSDEGYTIRSAAYESNAIAMDGAGGLFFTYPDGSTLCKWNISEISSGSYGSIEIDDSISAVIVGEEIYLDAVFYSTDMHQNGQNITWSVLGYDNGATIDSNTGLFKGDIKGDITVRVTSSGYSDEHTLTVYRPAVFLIHGRNDNSFTVWGAHNSVGVSLYNTEIEDNDDYNSSLSATVPGTQLYYTDINTQMIQSFSENGQTNDGVFNGEYYTVKIELIDLIQYSSTHSEGGNLAYYLVNECGYTPNVDLFVFNYPNQDAVKYNAQKLNAYLENLATEIRTNGTAQQKASFFGKTSGITASSPYNIDIVGHSMGGLVARYYIENLDKDHNVRKLITIGTPHWGSGLADGASITGALHHICDHDLRFDSCMYGGTFTTELNCNAIGFNCTNEEYTLTEELNYNVSRTTTYYAIAGLDYNATSLNQNNQGFEIDVDFETFDDIKEKVESGAGCNLYETIHVDATILNYPFDVKAVGDNTVGFLSQIGCTETGDNTPDKKIQFEKIFVNIDSDGGNSMISHLHGKMPHREVVMDKVLEYLEE